MHLVLETFSLCMRGNPPTMFLVVLLLCALGAPLLPFGFRWLLARALPRRPRWPAKSLRLSGVDARQFLEVCILRFLLCATRPQVLLSGAIGFRAVAELRLEQLAFGDLRLGKTYAFFACVDHLLCFAFSALACWSP